MIDSRYKGDTQVRRRQCLKGHRFTTVEMVQTDEMRIAAQKAEREQRSASAKKNAANMPRDRLGRMLPTS